MAPRTGNRRAHVPNRLAFIQRTPEELKRRVDRLADQRGVSTNTLINELLERVVEEDEDRDHDLERAA